MKLKRFFRAFLTAIPYVGSPIEQLLFGSKDDKKIDEIKERIKKSDEALNIQRDAEGNVVNNPFDQGVF